VTNEEGPGKDEKEGERDILMDQLFDQCDNLNMSNRVV